LGSARNALLQPTAPHRSTRLTAAGTGSQTPTPPGMRRARSQRTLTRWAWAPGGVHAFRAQLHRLLAALHPRGAL